MIRILGIEGAGDFDVLYNAFSQRYKNVTYQHCEWQDWAKYIDQVWHVVIGHSLGGDSAVRFAKNCIETPKLLVTVAARYQADVKPASWLDVLWWYDSAQVMMAPNKVTHNFWTYGPLPSAPMTGAVENVNVGSWFPYIWHGNAPLAKEVVACMDRFVSAQ